MHLDSPLAQLRADSTLESSRNHPITVVVSHPHLLLLGLQGEGFSDKKSGQNRNISSTVVIVFGLVGFYRKLLKQIKTYIHGFWLKF